VIYNLTVARNYIPQHDAAMYVGLAQNFLKWGCYCFGPGMPTTYRPPVFSLFLAQVFLVTSPNTLYARIALSVVGALTCVFVALIARDVFGPRVGALAGLMAATYPQLFIWDAWLYSESLAVCLFTASCLVVMRVVNRPVGWRWALAGGLLGLTALTRPNGIYALGAVVIWAIGALRMRLIPPPRALAGTLVLVAGCLAILAPWTVRNYIVTGGAFVPLSTGTGDVIAGAYNTAAITWPWRRGSWVNALIVPYWSPQDRALLVQAELRPCWGACEVAKDHVATGLGIRWAESHVRDLPNLMVFRMMQFWSPASPIGEAGMPIGRPFAVGYPVLVFILAAVGFVTHRRQWRALLLPWLFGAIVVVGALVFYGSPRMRAPLEPILLVMAAGGLAYVLALARSWVVRPDGPGDRGKSADDRIGSLLPISLDSSGSAL
jgi:4-amino-4-deoxy-L-arabinose transferase-like glycosyltransferase